MVFAEFGTGQVFWSLLWLFMWVIWFWMLIALFGDIFRSQDLSGWGKAFWSFFILILPFLGIFVYLIVRGSGMQERNIQQAQQADAAMRQYIQDTTSSTSAADEISKLAELHSNGVLEDAEFQAAKARLLA